MPPTADEIGRLGVAAQYVDRISPAFNRSDEKERQDTPKRKRKKKKEDESATKNKSGAVFDLYI